MLELNSLLTGASQYNSRSTKRVEDLLLIATKIINPLNNGINYTKHPEHFINLGIAEMHGNQLYFLDNRCEDYISPDMCFWNGSSKGRNKMHLPGQVRS